MASNRFSAEDIEASAIDWSVSLLTRYQELVQEGEFTESHRRHLRDLLSSVVWYWGGKGRHKFLGVGVWSKAALDSYQRHGRVVTSKGANDSLAHEHVVPRRAVVNALLDLSDVTPESVRGLLTELAIVAVVTVAEHDRLDDQIVDRADPWKRYRVANIPVVMGPAVIDALGDAADLG